MEKEALKHYLSDKYQGWESFCNTVIFPIFGKDDYEDKHNKEVLDIRPERRLLADATGIRSVKFCGQTYVSGEPFQFFDITVADKVMMERNRVNVQKIIRSVMDQYSSAFMIFHYEDEERWDWRFSFCYKSVNEEESTDRKRYTFLLGPKQSCRTAAENFLALYGKRQNDEEIELDDIINAFNVEALSKEFFDGYKKIYEDIIQYITGKRMVKVNNKWEEHLVSEPCEEIMQEFVHFANPEKTVRDYVKKLMGRLVFLQFIQKKGWLGVPVNKEWGEGSHTFIQDLFENTSDKDHFIDNVLESLFNDLNTERSNDIVSPAVGKNIRVPYLNGGLFERDLEDDANFPLPGEYMHRLLEFFSWYNFTIDENDPNDAEVGVDPEMLGRIFENLLEDNKDKGAFYTPKDIVSYMCRESLIAYLQTDMEDEATKEAIRQFVTTHDINALGSNDKFCQQVDEALKNVKICDPAIGSGAFPMALLKELFQCRTALEGIEQSKAAEIKKHIIQQNIYGVDIERGAVDIARLRFWLSLIVDEETPQALPNLDFKIMQGNSLLEQYKGVDLSNMTEKKYDATKGLSFFDNMVDVYRKNLREMLAKYYNCIEHKEKKKLRASIIDNVKKQLIEQRINVDFGNLNLSGNDQFFLWHTWFYDVFSQGGFDIVIGNPPYKSSKDIPSHEKDIYKLLYGTAEKQFDLYSVFIEKAVGLLCPNGVTSYIVPDSIIGRSNFKTVRKMIVLANSIYRWIHLNNVFESAVVSSLIYVCQKKKQNRYTFKYDKADSVTKWVTNNYNSIIIDSESVKMDIDNKIYFASQENIKLQNRLNKAISFGQMCIMWRGEEIGKNSVLISSVKSRGSYPIITGKEARRYEIPIGTKWIDGSDVKKTISNYCTKKILIRQVGDCINATIDNNKGVTTQSVYALFPKNTEDQKHLSSLLGILNSRLFDFFYRLVSGDKQMFKRIILENIKALPYPDINNAIINQLDNIVDRILNAKGNNPSTDTSSLEQQIDLLVYKLYGLTYDEVLIVDPNPPFTREEYEKK